MPKVTRVEVLQDYMVIILPWRNSMPVATETIIEGIYRGSSMILGTTHSCLVI